MLWAAATWAAQTHIMNMVTGLSQRNEVMLLSFRAGPFADEARERGIDVRVIERHNPFRGGARDARPGGRVPAGHYPLPRRSRQSDGGDGTPFVPGADRDDRAFGL